MSFVDRISPICLPIDGDILDRRFVDTNPFITGWGHTKENGVRTNILQQAQVSVMENMECKVDYKRIGEFYKDIQFDDRVLCAGLSAGGKDACQGDSGGPLMLPIHQNGQFPFYQIGIISYGNKLLKLISLYYD